MQAAEAGWPIWVIAPLIDGLLFATLGFLFAATLSSLPRLRDSAAGLSFGFQAGLFGVIAAWSLQLSREWVGNLTAIHNLYPPALGFLLGLVLGLIADRVMTRFGISLQQISAKVNSGVSRRSKAFVGLALVGLVTYAIRSSADSSPGGAGPTDPRQPNIVVITLDAARADHFSSYGYTRPTTPNMDALAERGVLFENAIAPSSWTLPSLASILSGLLPHQHGADEGLPAAPPFWNIAEILNKRGYETGGFNANTLYGQSAWGLGAGFETYGDYRNSFRFNLALTVAGRTLVQPAYERFVRYDVFCRRNAKDVSDEAIRWQRSRSRRPYFLFVHYFEPHDSYLPPPPYDRRFGRMNDDLAQRVSFGHALMPDRPFTAEEQRDIIAAYDNGLAYADDQIGRLLRAIEESPERDNTYIILTADHAEAFGEHGAYGHGWTLHREVLHVPLIIVGPRVPSGLRVSRMARTREVFPTVMELTLGERFPFSQATLRRHWNPAFQPGAYDEGVTSELSSGYELLNKPPSISMMTQEWQYIHYANGQQELYHLVSDPEERHDLSSLPESQAIMEQLRGRLAARVQDSVRPWAAPHYLLALDQPGFSFLGHLAFALPPAEPAHHGPQVGLSQSVFPPDTSQAAPGRYRTEQDLLRTLPYR